MGDSGEQPPDHPQAELSGRCSSVGSVSGPKIDPRLWHILLWKKLPSSAQEEQVVSYWRKKVHFILVNCLWKACRGTVWLSN